MKTFKKKERVVYDLTIYDHDQGDYTIYDHEQEDYTTGSYNTLEEAEEQLKGVLEWMEENPDTKLSMVIDKVTMTMESEVIQTQSAIIEVKADDIIEAEDKLWGMLYDKPLLERVPPDAWAYEPDKFVEVN